MDQRGEPVKLDRLLGVRRQIERGQLHPLVSAGIVLDDHGAAARGM
jgi:hypothetical protein